MVTLRPVQASSALQAGATDGPQLVSYPFVVSAKTPRALVRRATQLARWARGASAIDPAQVAYTLDLRRTRYPHHIVVSAATLDQFADALESFVASDGDVTGLTTEPGDDLANLFTPQQRRPVSLPPYPLERNSMWHPDSPTVTAEEFVRRIRLDDFWMRDHRLGKEHILPGVVYVELALEAALGQRGHGGSAVLNEIRYHQQFILSEGEAAADLGVTLTAGRAGTFEAVSRSVSSRTVHCTGRIEPLGTMGLAGFDAHPDQIDPAVIFAELGEPTSRAECYARIAANGLLLGPAFNAIEQLVADSTRVAAQLTAPAEIVSDYYEYWLHPSIFDGALEIVHRLADVRQLSMPVGIDRVGYVERPEPSCFAYATRSATQRPGEVRYDVSIYQPDGHRAVAVEGFTFQDLAVSGLVVASSEAHRYAVELVAARAGEPLPEALPQQLALIDGGPDLLTALGGQIAVSGGAQALDDADAVVVDLRHCSAESPSSVEQVYTQLLRVEQGLLGTAGALRQVIVVGADAGEPLLRALHAFALSVGVEQTPSVVTVIASDADAEGCARQIIHELGCAGGQTPGLVCWRDNRRSVLRTRRLDPVRVPSLQEVAGHGLFIIVGGTGAIGTMVCQELAQEANHLVLLGSRPADDGIAGQLEDLRSRGAGAEYYSVNLSDASQLRALFDQVEGEHGSITGVFHLAGTTADALLAEKDPTAGAAVLAPKIGGAIALASALRGREVEFLVLGSSLAAITGNAGQADYAFANGFLDGLACSGDTRNGFRILTLNWSMWRDGGIPIGANVVEMYDRAFGITLLTREQGLGSIAAALAGSVCQTVVVAGDPTRIDRHLGATMSASQPVTDPQAGPMDDSAARARVADEMRRIVVESIRLAEEDFDADRTIQDYGYTSLTMVDLANRINAAFGTSVTPALFFSATTVNELADYLVGHEREAVRRFCQLKPTRSMPGEPMPVAVSRSTVGSLWAGSSEVDEGFAIIGVDVRLPGAPDIDAYWRRLVDRQCMIGTVPTDRWDWRSLDADLEAAGQDPISHFGGFLESVADFDRQLFGISPREAVLMDPQQRLVMECVHKTVESAGYRMADLAGARMGIFMGVATMDYSNLLQEIGTPIDAYTSTGASHSMLVNRISFANNWTGPSEPIDTACSSSLVAIHRACEAIRGGSCDAAIAGGVNLIVSPLLHTAFSRAGMLSPTGLCHSFDAQADGYVRGEGVGAILIKRLSDAVADGDEILATIRGTAINHGGRAPSLTAPNPHAQAQVICAAWQPTGIDAATIGYIEAHGTGTQLGDPVEIDGLREAFTLLGCDGSGLTQANCRVGTVKANIGHLEASAGIAGIAKVVMMLRNGVIPGHPTLGEVNPYINLTESPFTIVRENETWHRARTADGAEVPLRAGVSSFGFGGANAHIALEEFRAPDRGEHPGTGEPQILVVSARTAASLNSQRFRLAEYLLASGDHGPELADLGYTLREGREADEHRALFVAPHGISATELAELIRPTHSGNFSRAAWCSADFDAERDRPAVLAALGQGQASELATAYLAGGSVDWRILRPERARRVRLPNTPLQPTRCWPVDTPPSFGATLGVVASKGTVSTRRGLHPMLDERDGTAMRFMKRLTAEEFFLADHVVNGQTILPGAAYAEIAYAVARQLDLPEQLTISNLTWKTVLALAQGQCTMTVQATDLGPAEPHTYDLVIASGSQSAAREHCTCTISPRLTGEPRLFDLKELGGRSEREFGRQHCYDTLYRRAGFEYGPSFQVTQKIRSWADGAVAELRLPEIPGIDDPRFVLHPSLIDGAIRAVAAIANQRHVSTYIPFLVERIDVFSACPRHCHAVAEVASDPGENIQNMAFNVSLTDDAGNECVRFTNLMVRGFAKGRDGDEGEFVLSPRWVGAGSVAASTGPLRSGPVLVISRHPEHCAAVVDYLAGQPDREVIQVCHLEGFRAESPGLRTIGDDLDADFAALWAELQASDRIPTEVLVDLDGYPGVGEHIRSRSGVELLRALTVGLNPLLAQRCRITLARPEALDPDQLLTAATIGFARSMAPVAPRMHWALLEIAPGVPFRRVAELALSPSSHPSGTLQRITGSEHQIEIFESLNDHELIGATPSLRPELVCIITGGAGAIGGRIARLLARKYRANLTLVGRRAPDERIAAELAELRDLGGTAEYLSADVTRGEQVDQLVTAVRDRWGRVDGIVHAAGVMGEAMILDAAPSEIEQVMATKMAGAMYLDAATVNDDLSFFVTFSSVSSLIGDRGSCSYGAANAYLDSFVELRERLRLRGERSGRSLSIGWPMWAEGGMPVPGTEAEFFAETGMRLLETSTALDIFDWMMTLDRHRLIYVKGRASTIHRVFRVSNRNAVLRADAAPEMVAPESPAPALQTCIGYLKALVAQVSGYSIAEIDETQEFEDFGIDSLMILDLNKRLGVDFPGLDRTIFFEYNRIVRLAEYLVAERAEDVEQLDRDAVSSANQAAEEPALVEPAGTPTEPVKVDSPLPEPGVIAGLAESRIAEPIAIIGMAGRFPEANSVAEFWTNLCRGRDSIIEVPQDRWNHEELLAAQVAGRSSVYAKWGAFLDDVQGFDPLLFKITHSDARHIDPQERLFLENVFGTMEDAGYSAFPEDPIDVGVYVGVMYGHYQLLALERTLGGAETVTSSAYASIANRVSYVFNFSGPSMAIDTMCSSSMTAIHLACEALRRRDCSMAIAGGVNVTIHPDKYRFLSAQHFAATDGRCRAFGAGGDGYVPGEAVASVLLKPLSEAERDHDQILAIIRGTAINHGGKTNGYTVTNPNAQAEVIGKALRSSGISARDVSYVEAHGTGTQLGDPIEIRGLVKTFNADTGDRAFCEIGSVKSNIGHAEGAAGIVSLIKTVQQLRHRMIVPSLHSAVLNPQIAFDQTPFEVPQQLHPWRPRGTAHDGERGPLIAGVSSFGAGGSNAHIIVEQYLAPADTDQPTAVGEPQLIPFSARNQAGLDRLLAVWEAYLAPSEDSQQIAEAAAVIIEVVAELLQIPSDQIDVNLSLDELGIDAFLSDGLTTQFLERTGLRVTWAEIAHLDSLAGVVRYVRALQKPSESSSPVASGLPTCLDMAFTMQRGRIHQAGARAALIVRDHAELLAGIRALRTGQTSSSVYSSTAAGQCPRAEQVTTWLAAADLKGLAEAFVAGSRIDWFSLAADPGARRVGLPLYPCERHPLWLDPLPVSSASRTSAADGLAPLVAENLSTLDLTRFRVDLDPGFGAISDHVIQGLPLLPAAQYLEVLAEVGRLAGAGEVRTIRNVIWKSAVPVTTERPLFVELTRRGELVRVRMQPDHPGDDACFEAEVEVARRGPSSFHLDLAAVRADMDSRIDRSSVYAHFTEVGMSYGELMRPVIEVLTSDSALLASLELPTGWSGNPFDLHPSLLDGAFQAVAASTMGPGGEGERKQVTVPFGLTELTIHAPIPDHCLVHVTPRLGGSFAAERRQKLPQYRLRILDLQGQVVVDINGFSGMVVPGSADPIPLTRADRTVDPISGSALDLLQALENGAVSQEHVINALSEHHV